MTPTLYEAFFGGVRTFFSIWQLCIMQITPFYAAFLISSFYLVKKEKLGLVSMAFIAVFLAAGFSVAFALSGTPGLGPSMVFLRHMKAFRFWAGVVILASGVLMALMAFCTRAGYKNTALILISPVAGAAIALGYSPCIAPALSRILNFASAPGNTDHALRLLVSYGAGLSSSITLVSVVFLYLVRKKRKSAKKPTAAAVLAALVFMVMGALLVTGLMFRFKMFLVNIF